MHHPPTMLVCQTNMTTPKHWGMTSGWTACAGQEELQRRASHSCRSEITLRSGPHQPTTPHGAKPSSRRNSTGVRISTSVSGCRRACWNPRRPRQPAGSNLGPLRQRAPGGRVPWQESRDGYPVRSSGWECEKRQRRLTRSGRYDLTPAAHPGHPDRPRPAAALS